MPIAPDVKLGNRVQIHHPDLVNLYGCSVGDDYSHALGDPLEQRFAAALAYRQTTTCPTPSGFAPPGMAALSSGESGDGVIRKPLLLQNRIMRR